MTKTRPPYQQRVLDEKGELYIRLGKLEIFIGSLQFDSLPEAEQERMRKQQGIMQQYLSILDERIEAFSTPNETSA